VYDIVISTLAFLSKFYNINYSSFHSIAVMSTWLHTEIPEPSPNIFEAWTLIYTINRVIRDETRAPLLQS